MLQSVSLYIQCTCECLYTHLRTTLLSTTLVVQIENLSGVFFCVFGQLRFTDIFFDLNILPVGSPCIGIVINLHWNCNLLLLIFPCMY